MAASTCLADAGALAPRVLRAPAGCRGWSVHALHRPGCVRFVRRLRVPLHRVPARLLAAQGERPVQEVSLGRGGATPLLLGGGRRLHCPAHQPGSPGPLPHPSPPDLPFREHTHTGPPACTCAWPTTQAAPPFPAHPCSCPENCYSCSDSETCLQGGCGPEGLTLDPAGSGKCIPCTSQGCTQCSKGPNACDSCDTGYTMMPDQTCRKCTAKHWWGGGGWGVVRRAE